jgi:serine/threonine protein kinase
MLGKYRIVRPLGSGGMAAVYEALHTGIGKPVAIKTLRAVATDARAEARFLREAAAASRLDHPHVVDVTDFGTENGLSYLVMELLRGEDMGAVVTREPGTLDPTFVVDVMLAVCAGVFAAHESGVIHRDLKPQNIFLARTPLGELVPKVLDFGISKRLDEDVGARLTNSGALLGTTHYLSPEQIAGKPLDVRSDQYSLGVILYEALTGQRPHEGNTAYVVMHSIGEGKFALPRKLRPDIPAPLEAIVVRAMSSRPQDRFESVHGLGRALLPMASSKRRVIWSDYYERDRPPVSPSAPPSYPDPPRPPVSNEKGTMAIDAFRANRAEATRTRSAPVMRPPAPTRMALPQQVAAVAEAQGAAGSGAVEAAPPSRRDKARGAKASRSSGLRNAVVIAGLIALGAGGYAAWVDPEMADRIPQNVKASIRRHLPAEPTAEGAGTPAAGNAPAGEQPRPVPAETRVTLGEKPIPISGGLTPPSAEELEAARQAAAASQPPDAAPVAVDPATGAPVDLGEKSPEELAAAGSPEPAELGPIGARPGTAAGRKGLPAQSRAVTGADVRAGIVEPYAPGDATMRALRLLRQQEKKRRESTYSPETPSRTRPDPAPAESPRVKPSLNPAGAPILE